VVAAIRKVLSFFVEPDWRRLVGVLVNRMGDPYRVIRVDRNLEATTEKTMVAFQTSQGTVSQDIVTKVGVAAGQIARIQQAYLMEAEAETSIGVRETLAGRARDAAERVIDEQGLTIQDYNTVLTAAEADEDLERRLLDAAREVL
jgi:hypothetical protein